MVYEISDITVFVTSDYSEFKKLHGNRQVLDERVNSIIDSISKVGYQPNAILVNEKCEVIDGQGRLEACKRLGLPVYFVMRRGIGIKECIAMNIKMKNWDIYDFINSYISQNNENYLKLDEYANMYSGMNILDIAMCLSNAYSRNVSRPLRDGTFEIILSDENIQCLNFINSIAGDLAAIRGGSLQYIPILVGLYKLNLIDEDRMRDAIKLHNATMGSAYNADDALTELQKVYNYHKRHNEYFRDKYFIAMEQKGARYKN